MLVGDKKQVKGSALINVKFSEGRIVMRKQWSSNLATKKVTIY